MFIFYKYKNISSLNNNYFINFENEKFILNYSVKYVFNYRSKILRNFLYFYSIFLIFLPFSIYQLKNNPEFKINFNSNSFIFLDENYSDFFLYYNK